MTLSQTSHTTDIEPDKEYEFRLLLYDGNVVVQSLEGPVTEAGTSIHMKIRFSELPGEESHTYIVLIPIFVFLENNNDSVKAAATACGIAAGILLLVMIGLLVIFQRKFYPIWKGTLINCFKRLIIAMNRPGI